MVECGVSDLVVRFEVFQRKEGVVKTAKDLSDGVTTCLGKRMGSHDDVLLNGDFFTS